MTEEHLERETLGWLADTGYSHCHGLEIAPDGPQPERSSYSQVLLVNRLQKLLAVPLLKLLVVPYHKRLDRPWALQVVLT